MDEPEQIPDAMKKRQRRITIGICLFFAAVFVAGVHQRLHGILLLRGMLAELDNAGEEMDYRKFPIHLPDPTNNMVPALLTLSNRLDAIHELLRSAPKTQAYEHGRLRSPFDLSEWECQTLGSSATYKYYTNTWENFAAEILPHSPLVDLALKALGKPHYHSGYRPEDGFHRLPMQPLMNSRQVERLLAAAFLIQMKNGNTADAIRYISAIQNLINGLGNESLIISESIRQAIAIGTFHLTWHALDQAEWKDEQLATWQSFWKNQSFAADYLDAFRMERSMNLEVYYRLAGRSGSATQRRIEWEESGSLIEPGTAKFIVAIPLWKLVWMEQDCCRMLENWSASIELMRLSISDGWKRATTILAAPSSPRPTPWYDEYRFLFAGEDSYMDPEFSSKRALQMESLRALAICGLAIHRHLLKHGSPPDSLNKLSPTYLKLVPLDPFDRKPLRYRVDGDEWVLYSVGENIDDEGGEVEIGAPGKPVESIFDGADIVWPRPALPNQTEEIQNN